MSNPLYTEQLYPLQDKVLAQINQLNVPFYLTGGTALSRHYLNHRYSDDLDLFVNSDPNFKSYVERIEAILKSSGFSCYALTRSDDFVRLEIRGNHDLSLKLDLVNDLVCHFGELEQSSLLGKVDNIFNILSNKISALPRLEIKDFVDVAFISMNYKYNWEQVLNDASEKDLWVNPIDVSRYFSTTDPKLFSLISWVEQPDYDHLLHVFHTISSDILSGTSNTVCTKS